MNPFIRSNRPLAAVLCALGMTFSLAASAQSSQQLAAARDCTEESQRLERLACFDEVFGTPVEVAIENISGGNQPERWRQAFAQEQRRKPGEGPLYRDTEQLAGHLLTLSALGVKPPRPLLAVQCHNNITELTLMLPEAVKEERVTVDFGQGRQIWRVRDDGYVISGGRGLPAIRTVRNMAASPGVTVASSSSVVDGLMFDLTGFRDTLKPLREACGW
ncbi:type VI secretion system-associated protein TagO [Marinobacter sp. 71-i]|uniref:Type VI secretion system-associated protein TagO n=1 Tax=Marinobacter iranensis TaxID=2962607 RepID=A0ABT5YDC0_9GAMM|nr:type VI secretion system-associated protein VasI [Marinobacter iranensis]MDF0751687.1 type VI secretion system-associated protein TagO [Marinobacter iranensis]